MAGLERADDVDLAQRTGHRDLVAGDVFADRRMGTCDARVRSPPPEKVLPGGLIP